jgi:anti-sigma B factor antagonist
MNSCGSTMMVIQPTGALTAASADAFKQELLSAISCETAKELMVDLSQVDALDSAGLMSLMTALNRAQALSKQLTICAVPPSIRIVFELTQLDRVFTLIEHSPLPEAVAA